MAFQLRDYQLEAIDRAQEAFRAHRRVMLVAPTGAGKSAICAQVAWRAHQKGKHVLILAHRRELIYQLLSNVVRAGVPQDQVGVILAGDKQNNRPTARIQIASIDTLRGRSKPPADLVITDESHRAVSASYLALFEHYQKAYHLLPTATPMRLDKKSLREVADTLVVVTTPRKLIAAGHLAEPRVFGAPKSALPDLDGVATRAGDYAQDQLEAACDQTTLVGSVVDNWFRYAEGRQTVVAAVGRQHMQHLADAFKERGIKVACVDGTTPLDERARTLADFGAARIQVLCQVNVCTEGWDEPICKCLVMARPTQSTTLYLQLAGRILRPWNNVTPIILDHARNVEAHGFPQDDRDFSLDPPKRKKPGMAPVRTCPECYAVLPATSAMCPQCGHVFRDERVITEASNVDLVELKPQSRRSVYEDLLKQDRGTGWANTQFKKRFGSAPPADWQPVATGKPTERQAFYQEKWLECRAKGYKEGRAAALFKVRYGMWPTQWDRAFATSAHEFPIEEAKPSSPGAPFDDWVKEALK